MVNDILIIDDEEELRNLLAKLLRLEGYKVDITGTGKEGLSLFRKQEQSLVITDVRLPDANGLKLLEEVKKLIR